MLPSLSVSVGVPPVVLTVTASLVVRVKVTVLPALRSPLDGDSAIALIVGVVVSTMTPVKVSGRPVVLSALPARSVMVPVTPVTCSAAVFCPPQPCS